MVHGVVWCPEPASLAGAGLHSIRRLSRPTGLSSDSCLFVEFYHTRGPMGRRTWPSTRLARRRGRADPVSPSSAPTTGRAHLEPRIFPGDRRGRVRPAMGGVAIVRRPTGGGAIWHHHEVTYALVLPATHPRARRGGTLYHEVHAAIADLSRLGHRRCEAWRSRAARPTSRPSCASRPRSRRPRPPGSKVVGSAQRRRAGRSSSTARSCSPVRRRPRNSPVLATCRRSDRDRKAGRTGFASSSRSPSASGPRASRFVPPMTARGRLEREGLPRPRPGTVAADESASVRLVPAGRTGKESSDGPIRPMEKLMRAGLPHLGSSMISA